MPQLGATRHAFPALCRRLIAANPQDWRARLALARHPVVARDTPREALELLFEALVHNPHALAMHQAIWDTLSRAASAAHARRATSTSRATRSSTSIPHICVRCRYRSTELLWQCPHCHEWNTFVEERIAPAKDTEADADVVTQLTPGSDDVRSTGESRPL